MKTVTIPNDYHPYEVEVNGKEYRFPAGATVSVPDEVAAVIENYYKLQPKEKPTDGGALPYVSKENDGDVLTVKDGAWTTEEGGNGNIETFVGVQSSGIDFGTVLKLEEYMNTPKFFAVANWGGASEDTDLCVILDNYLYRFNYRYVYCWKVNSISGTILYVSHDNLSGWGEGMQMTLPPTADCEYGDVLKVGMDGEAEWGKGAGTNLLTIEGDAETMLDNFLVAPVTAAAEASADHTAMQSLSYPSAFNSFAPAIATTFLTGNPAAIRFKGAVSFIESADSINKAIAWRTTITGTQGLYEYMFVILENNITAKLNITVV